MSARKAIFGAVAFGIGAAVVFGLIVPPLRGIPRVGPLAVIVLGILGFFFFLAFYAMRVRRDDDTDD